jgi:hypothetical protein
VERLWAAPVLRGTRDTLQSEYSTRFYVACIKAVILIENAGGRFFEGTRLVPKEAASSHGGDFVCFVSRDRGAGLG